MASTSSSESLPEKNNVLIDQFCSVTGSCKDKACKILEVCNWNLELAINMHVDSDSAGENFKMSDITLSDNIRAPIPQSRAILVEEDISFHHGLRKKRRSHSVFDGLRDFQAEARMHEFKSENESISKKRKTLEDLFRPPLDLIHRGNFESARDYGQLTNRWVMVNIQNSLEFACQVLNRDVWSNPAVKNLVSKYFVFWQVYSDSIDGERYMQFYKAVEYPYVAIIDPRTGEKLVEWHHMDSATFCNLVDIFLKEYSHPNNTSSNDSPPPFRDSLIDKSEEEQLKAALAESLKNSVLENEDHNSDLETFDSDSEHQNDKAFSFNTDSDHSNGDVSVVECDKPINTKREENWKSFLGSEKDLYSELVLRLPDGNRKQISWPCSTKIKSLVLYTSEIGFDSTKYELVTNFPRRVLSNLDLSKTLKEVDLFPREMIIIQQKI